MIAGLVVVAALLSQTYYTPEEAKALFAQGNDAYSREDYAAAQDAYRKLLDHGYGGPDVLFNLGTASLAKGELGEAVLALERARRLSHAEDIEANLAVARSKQIDQVVGGVAEDPFLQRVVAATPAKEIGWTFLASWCAGFLLVIVHRFLPRGRRAWAAALAAFSLVVAVPTGALLAAHAYAEATEDEAVVLAKMIKARDLPKDSAKVSFELHAGSKVRVLDESGGFVKIRLPNGLEGWTEREGLSRI